MSAAWRLSNRLSARVMRYHGSRQMASNRLEPSASYRYFDCSCFGVSARSRRRRRRSRRRQAFGHGHDFCRWPHGRHRSELRVDVRIVRPEPVAEAPAQQLPGGRRRASLHHVVLAVEELRRVFRVRRPSARSRRTARTSWRSTPSRCRRGRARPTRSRRPDASRPAPAPSSESRSCRAVVGWLGSPGIRGAPAPCRRLAERGAVILGLGRQAASLPARVGGGFRLADVDGPGRRQRNLLEHAAPDHLDASTRSLALRRLAERPGRVGSEACSVPRATPSSPADHSARSR